MSIKAEKEKKLKELKNLLDSKEINNEQFNTAVKLTKSFNPWYWERNNKGKIVDIVDSFASLSKELNSKKSRKNKKS